MRVTPDGSLDQGKMAADERVYNTKKKKSKQNPNWSEDGLTREDKLVVNKWTGADNVSLF